MTRAPDCVSLSIPLLIRLMEWAREDAKDDMALHRAAENMMALEDGEPLAMGDYEHIVDVGKR